MGGTEAPSALYGTEVAGGTCWHLALSTKGGVDRDLSDEEWAEVARETVRQLGFDARGGQSPCRWVAVRHGRSDAGNDHMHFVVNLVRENGKVASTRNDFKRLSALCTALPPESIVTRGYWRLGSAGHSDHDYGDDA
jgi:hypothetical protein